jgi:hypothetical protein
MFTVYWAPLLDEHMQAIQCITTLISVLPQRLLRSCWISYDAQEVKADSLTAVIVGLGKPRFFVVTQMKLGSDV